jgi:hypothetical protein
LSGQPSANYAVHITSAPPEHDGQDTGALYQSVHRVKVMEPANDLSLSRFLEMQRRFGAYLIAPAVTIRGRIEILTDLAILKRHIPVVYECDVEANDLGRVALDLVARRTAG